jgi:two-component system response regulator
MIERTLLLVEDNPDDELLMLRAFERGDTDIRIDVVRDGAEALEYMFAEGRHADRLHSALPQVILLDLKLPKIDGLDVLARIKGDKRTESVPIVVLTSSNEDQDIIKSYSLHANSYIQKPVDFNQFIETVEQLGKYWLALNRSPGQH